MQLFSKYAAPLGSLSAMIVATYYLFVEDDMIMTAASTIVANCVFLADTLVKRIWTLVDPK